MNKWIAERKLKCAPKGSEEIRDLVVRIGAPYLLELGMVDFKFSPGTAGCTIEIIGPSPDDVFEGSNVCETYGADTLQALNLASDIEPMLKRLSKKYDIFFPSGEPYFE
ncbi:MAG: hypothetical protein R3213_10575 [Flavobacteriaceae bacterium]|nr:hypothetical protein [Flavobacteriaceae bacterium]